MHRRVIHEETTVSGNAEASINEGPVGGEMFVAPKALEGSSSRSFGGFNKRFAAAALAVLITTIAISSNAAQAQRRSTGPAAFTAIPSPKSVFGFEPGQDRTIIDWKQITDYFARLDKASDRVQVTNIGTSTLGRQMFAAFISAPENIRNLDKYKAIQAKLADPRKIISDAERDELIRDGKTVVAISCSIHSTEIVASQMSTQLAYELASDNRPDTLSILQNTILILIPSPNPDGVDIVANHYRKTLGTNTEGSSPPELYHYYAGHDDNRDWFMLDLKETKAVTRLFWKEWFPEIVYDIHQQGSNGSRFFVPPFYDPPNPHINALLLRQVGLIGHKMAADVTAAGFKGVLTNALYDTWWHGGFRTAPYFHNSIGILTEASSARLMSPSNVTREQLARSSTRGMGSALEVSTNFPNPWPGGAWHPHDIMQMEMIACHSVLSLASNYRADYLRNFYELGKAGLAQPSSADPIAYLIPAGQGRDENVAKMIGTLVEQGVEVHRLDKELHGMTGAQVLRKLPNGSRQITLMPGINRGMPEIPAGSYMVFVNQPYRQNVLALFEPQTYPDRTTATGEAERPYDVAGWTLPMSMGIETPVVTSITEPANERKLSLIKSENDVRKDFALPLWTSDKSPIANPIKPGIRVAIYQNTRSGNMDEGWTRYVFDTFNVPYKSVNETTLNDADPSANFDAIVLPSEQARGSQDSDAPMQSENTRGISEKGYANLAKFVEGGGTLICFDGSCAAVIRQMKLPLRNVLAGVRSSDFYCPGSILRINVDTANPIARTMSKDTDAYFISSSAFETTDNKVQVVARYAKDDVLRSGWLRGEDRIKDKIALAEMALGRGHIVLFGFRPQHRGQTWGTFPFIWNAVNLSAGH
jgi:hypothetical protein